MDVYTTRRVAVSVAVIATAVLVVRTLASSATENSGTGRASKRKSNKARATRTKNVAEFSPQYVTGLVNVGNTCFMNAVVQALASLPSLRTYLEARKDMGHAEDSITLALWETVDLLNTMHRHPTVKRLIRMVNTVKSKAAHVLTSQQQDAQELFQILSSQLSEEREKLDHLGTLSLFDQTAMSDILNPPSSPPLGARHKRSLSVISSSLSLSQLKPLANELNGESAPSSEGEGIDNRSNETKDKEEPLAMIASLLLDGREQEKFNRAKSPFMGLLASRVSCVECGYTAAIRHSTFDNLSLTVPLQYSCSLDDCLNAFIHLDTITDFNCRKCSILAASRDLQRKIEQKKRTLAESQEQRNRQRKEETNEKNLADDHDQSVKEVMDESSYSEPQSELGMDRQPLATKEPEERQNQSEISLEELEQWKKKLDQCLANNIEMDLSPLELAAVRSKNTTKHSMIAKPPQALCLHLNRSMFTASGQLAKNPCKVIFGERLDFTRFTTSGYLTTVATKSMSRRGSNSSISINHGQFNNGSNGYMADMSLGLASGTSARPGIFARRGSIGLYSLSSSTSSCNEYDSPETKLNGQRQGSWDKDMDASVDDSVIYCLWAVIVHMGSHNSGHFVTYRRIPSLTKTKSLSKWWRISDEDVQIVDWSTVKTVEAYMLFFEKEP